jgi:hypothetical protein
MFDFDVSDDARIFGRPLFEGVLRPDYIASPSPLYLGMGSNSGFFTIGDTGLPVAHVDEIRFQIREPANTAAAFRDGCVRPPCT